MPRDNLLFGVGLFPNGLFNNNIPRNNMNGAGPTLLNNNNPNYVNANQLATVRDRMFHAIFHRMAVAYARTFPKPIRRLLEWLFLLKALAAFLMLLYIHIIFSRSPITCLDHIKADWPRDGIVRIDITRSGDYNHPDREDYSLHHSYAKEQRIHQREQFEYQAMFGFWTGPQSSSSESIETEPALEETESTSTEIYYNETLKSNITNLENEQIETVLPTEVTELDKIIRATVWPPEEYIVEFSLEYGFLRLSPATRRKLNITILLVTLDPVNNSCFGDSFGRFLLDEFLGYNDFIMGAVKALAEAEDSQGYLRNVVTGEHYRFVNMWMARTSYIASAFAMVIFTLSISMLLRYSRNQIFIFIVDLLQMLEFNVNVTFPVASFFTVILALVGMEAIMAEFFNDSSTAFYVIIFVWVADQYDAVCCHTAVTKRHWLRFFYLYHYAFYAYHYRFNGQYSGLALVTSWLFTQHSMLYFFHHYELPLILRQVQLQNMLIRTSNSSSPSGSSSTATAASAPTVDGVMERNAESISEVDSEAAVDFETIDRDSDSPAPETPSDDSEMESIVDGAPADVDPPSSSGDGISSSSSSSSSSSITTATTTTTATGTTTGGVETLPTTPHPLDSPDARHPLRDLSFSLLR
ncbi:membralin-like [Daphnia carinata]|uniref:membralin-like n=1 Tax=Daphnia carinata TaxID=120202 RepID=UPI002868C5F7|nr:membralin-like [Daphnia carinata]